MPEGDTIHKLARYLRPRLEGRRIDSGRVHRPPCADLDGRLIEAVQAHGKHLFLALDDGRLLRSHLGMWGSWHRYGEGEPWKRPAAEAAIELRVGGQVYVCFKPREVELLRDRGVRRRLLDGLLGPDLIGSGPDYDRVVARAREILEPETPLADVLLEQRVAAGIGNVYKSELLFLERQHPLRRIDAISDRQLRAIYRRASGLLRANSHGGPRVTRPRDDQPGHLWVYGRSELPCLRCDTPVQRAMLGRAQRSTYWCPRCQPAQEAVHAAT